LGEERVVVNIKLHCFDTGALAYCIDQRVIVQFFELSAEIFLYSAIMPSFTPNEKKNNNNKTKNNNDSNKLPPYKVLRKMIIKTLP